MKCLTDRCLPFMLHYMGNQTGDGSSFHELRDENMHNKKLVFISTCGYVETKSMYPALLKQYDLICGENCYTSIICPEGELFIAEKAKRQRESYLRDVKEAGKEFSEKNCISEKTMSKISIPILLNKSVKNGQ